MRKSLMRWIAERQRSVLKTDEKMAVIRERADSITQQVRDHRRHEMRIAEISPSNPVYDRIKGRTK